MRDRLAAMIGPIEVLVDGFDRIQEVLHEILDGVAEAELAWQPGAGANTLGWLTWHLARVQDAQVADLATTGQVWTADGWADRFSLPFEPSATGYGQDPQAVTAVQAAPQLIAGYYDAVHDRTLEYLRGVDPAQLERVVDERWDPPVTCAVRLVSILSDDLQHVGQAAYVRGLLDRR